jgi:hypothetical protein
MSKTFAVMQTNVGNMVMDTSTSFATLIGVWINDKYRDVSRRCEWSKLIDNDYTIAVTAVAGASYDLPTLFDHEIFVADKTNGIILDRYNEGNWWRDRATAYTGAAISTGQPLRYIIEREAAKIRLDPAPNATLTLAMPYKKLITDLTSTGTPVITDIEWIIEMGAASEACAYKRQYTKAAYYLQRYEVELSRRIGQERSQINQMYQWIPEGKVIGLHRMTGDTSYDSL